MANLWLEFNTIRMMDKKLGIVQNNIKTLGETARNYPMSIAIFLFVLLVSFFFSLILQFSVFVFALCGFHSYIICLGLTT